MINSTWRPHGMVVWLFIIFIILIFWTEIEFLSAVWQMCKLVSLVIRDKKPLVLCIDSDCSINGTSAMSKSKYMISRTPKLGFHLLYIDKVWWLVRLGQKRYYCDKLKLIAYKNKLILLSSPGITVVQWAPHLNRHRPSHSLSLDSFVCMTKKSHFFSNINWLCLWLCL